MKFTGEFGEVVMAEGRYFRLFPVNYVALETCMSKTVSIKQQHEL